MERPSLDQIFNGSNSSQPSGGQQSLEQIFRSTVKPKPPTPPQIQTAQPDNAISQIKNTAKGFASDTNAHAANIVQDISDGPSFGTAGDIAGQVAGEVGDILKHIFSLGYQATTPPIVKSAISKLGELMAQNHQASQSKPSPSNEFANNNPLAKLWQDFSTKNPDLAKGIAGTGEMAGLVAGTPEADVSAGGVADVVKTGAKTAREMVADTVSGIKNTASDVASGVKNMVTGTKNTVGELINGKTAEQILATPENQVYKLSAPERKLYFDNQQEQVTNTRTLADQKVKANLDTKATASQAEADALTRKLAVASRDETVALRPQIRTALAKQSQTYRNLVDEAIAPHANVPVSATELKQYVDSRFPDNPGMSEAINGKLGLTGDNVASPLAKGELPSTQVGEPIAHGGQFNPSKADTTLGKIYEQTKSLKQDLGTAATKGTRVYSADEKMTDDAISTLADFMKSKGVDLSEANKFWARYAPVRNQLVSEAKPFLQVPTQTKTFASTLSRVAKGTDVNNENFIGQVEDLVGHPLATEQKSIVSKLTANEKSGIADEVAAEESKLQNKLDADLASKKISDSQFETERLAGRRSILKKIFYTAGGLGIDKIVKHYTGIGL